VTPACSKPAPTLVFWAVHWVRKDLNNGCEPMNWRPGTSRALGRATTGALGVERAEVGAVDLLMVWRGKDTGWELLVLRSSLQGAGV